MTHPSTSRTGESCPSETGSVARACNHTLGLHEAPPHTNQVRRSYLLPMAAPIVVITGPSGAGKTTGGGLVAKAFDPSIHIRVDDFLTPFVVNGWIDPNDD